MIGSAQSGQHLQLQTKNGYTKEPVAGLLFNPLSLSHPVALAFFCSLDFLRDSCQKRQPVNGLVIRKDTLLASPSNKQANPGEVLRLALYFGYISLPMMLSCFYNYPLHRENRFLFPPVRLPGVHYPGSACRHALRISSCWSHWHLASVIFRSAIGLPGNFRS